MCSEGLYAADPVTNTNRLCSVQKIKDFNKNTEPSLSIGQRVTDLFRGCGMCMPKHTDTENGMYIFKM